MPVLIEEVVITVEVSNPPAGGASTAASSADDEHIVRTCVEKVLEILRQREER